MMSGAGGTFRVLPWVSMKVGCYNKEVIKQVVVSSILFFSVVFDI